MYVKKRDGRLVKFDGWKIANAISRANDEVGVENRLGEDDIRNIVFDVEESLGDEKVVGVETIQDFIEDRLMALGWFEVARTYIRYRYKRMLVRKSNSTDESIMSLIRGQNKELNEENSNKNTMIASTQRDYIAGEVSRDVTKRMLLPPHIVEAHEKGILHFHDMDYFIQPIFNCCLINIGDMLDNGTVINGKMIETPKSFRTACTIMTQIIACIASNQYGGQSVDIKHLGKYLRKSAEKIRRKLSNINIPDDERELLYKTLLHDELSAGVQKHLRKWSLNQSMS